MNKRIGRIIVCMMVFVPVLSVTAAATTFELNGTWWVDRDSDGGYDIQGNVTLSVTTRGTQRFGIGLVDGVWDTTGSDITGSITGIFWYRFAPILYRAYHGFFKGTITDSNDLSQGIKGKLTAFDPDNLWTLDFPQGRAIGKCPRGNEMT